MKKYKNGNIGFNSTLEHRMVERVRYNLKKSGIFDIKTIYHDYYTWIIKGKYAKINEYDYEYYEPIKIYILMRNVVSDKVAMNRSYYELERAQNNNPLLVLSDRRYLYPVKFLFLDNINFREYKEGMTPLVLFPERDFEEIKYLRNML